MSCHVKFARFVPAVSEEGKTSFFFLFCSMYLRKRGSLGEREGSVFTAFSSSPTLLSVFV